MLALVRKEVKQVSLVDLVWTKKYDPSRLSSCTGQKQDMPPADYNQKTLEVKELFPSNASERLLTSFSAN